MNTKVNGMPRKDLFMDIIKKNAYLCSVDLSGLGNCLNQYPRSSEWHIKVNFKMSLLTLRDLSFDDRVERFSVKLDIMSPTGEHVVKLNVPASWIRDEYGIDYEKVYRIVTTYPTFLKLTNPHLQTLVSLHGAHAL